jgi:hypothetical protein
MSNTAINMTAVENTDEKNIDSNVPVDTLDNHLLTHKLRIEEVMIERLSDEDLKKLSVLARKCHSNHFTVYDVRDRIFLVKDSKDRLKAFAQMSSSSPECHFENESLNTTVIPYVYGITYEAKASAPYLEILLLHIQKHVKNASNEHISFRHINIDVEEGDKLADELPKYGFEFLRSWRNRTSKVKTKCYSWRYDRVKYQREKLLFEL